MMEKKESAGGRVGQGRGKGGGQKMNVLTKKSTGQGSSQICELESCD